MSLFIETICLRWGEWQQLAQHQRRWAATRLAHFGETQPPALAALLPPVPAAYRDQPRVKCRLVYGSEGILRLDFEPYVPKKINSLRLVDAEGVAYAYKFADRRPLEVLYAKRDGGDEVLIVKNGLLTDASYANVLLERDGVLFTPARPLLEGTKRAALLHAGRVIAADIATDVLPTFERVHLINAMLDVGEVVVPIEALIMDNG